MDSETGILHTGAVELLKELVATPSFSKEEDQTAGIIGRFLHLKASKQDAQGTMFLHSINTTIPPGKPFYSTHIMIL